MANWISNFVRTIVGNEPNPDKVVEVRAEKFSDWNILSREDSIVLYRGPQDKYEILMHRPCTESLSLAYSLFRSEDASEAKERFLILKDKVPFLCNLSNTNLNTLQKFCTTIQEHPSWSLCHLAVYFNLIDSIQNSVISSYINSSDPATGISPLQLAVEMMNVAMINKLIDHNASLDHLDHNARTVFHYAAVTNKDVIPGKDKKELKSLNCRDATGQTPLHVACSADKPDCVKALLLCGADVNVAATRTSPGSAPVNTLPGVVGDLLHNCYNKLQAQEMKNGGTPLHWASSREVIDALLDRNCDINALNFQQRTALHVMVMKNNVDCAVTLLAREADTSIVDEDGNAAIHLAVKQKHLVCVKALVVFGADLALKNRLGETARHLAGQEENEQSELVLYTLHAVGAPRCSTVLPSCNSACAPGGTRDGVPPPPPPAPLPRTAARLLDHAEGGQAPKRGGRLLCLDGGGIRGLVLVMLLLHLEEAAGKPITYCFDWFAATSTGAILALAIAAGKSLKECLCLYFRMKDQTFCGLRPYSSEPLETMLKETLGTDTTMADIKHPKLIITGCLADRKPIDLHIFRNYESPSELLEREHGLHYSKVFGPISHYTEQLIWEAARASGAAPSYFRAFGRFVDGGLIANNPTLDALTEIHEYNSALRHLGRHEEAVDLSVVVSLGTGSVPLTKVECMDIFWPTGILETARMVSSMMSMQSVLVDQATLADGRVVDRTRSVCSMLGIPHFRFSPQLSEDIAMDEKSDEKLVNMLWETKVYIHSQPEVLSRLASLI
ncbi:hypothetical protein AAG570_013410 [Ranatra chinensis]|uniref:phospholipase A2 n=1 Tax=Ranatra chinensis TaxID=642074 RepID=A0ABD0YC43_9HEMI